MRAFDVGVVDGIKLAAERDEALNEGEARKALLYGGAGMIGGSAATKGIALSLKPSSAKWNESDAQRMMQHMKLKNVDVNARPGMHAAISHMDVEHGTNRPFVVVPAHHGPELLAHELGHVSRKGRSAAGFHAQNRIVRGALPIAGAIGGTAMALKGKRGSWTTRLAPAVAFGSHVPTLVSEGRASIRGYKALKALGKYTPSELRGSRRNLIKAFSTYGLGALASTAPAAAIAAMRWKKKKED